MAISPGDRLPDVTFKRMTGSGPQEVASAELLGRGRVALFAVPGAFTPTCTNSHMPSFVRNAETLRARGVARIVCVAVNDPFVLAAWGEATGAAAAGVELAADPDARFAKALGMDFDGSAAGLGVRSKRYSMLVQDGVVRTVNVEDSPGATTCSTGEALLEQL